jgi:NAD-specific glutamate dehydrogenase
MPIKWWLIAVIADAPGEGSLMTSNQPDRLNRIETNLERLEIIVEKNSQDFDKLSQELKEAAKKWDERFYQLTKDNLNISRTIIITSGAAIIFSPLLRELTPTIKAFIDQFIARSN